MMNPAISTPERRELFDELREEQDAIANGGPCDECECFTVLPACGSCGSRLCEEHNRPSAHNGTCSSHPS